MVLISIHPFAVRKIFLLAVALLSLSSAVCFADPLFMMRQHAQLQDQERPPQRQVVATHTRDIPVNRRVFKTRTPDSVGSRAIILLGLSRQSSPELEAPLFARIGAAFAEIPVQGPFPVDLLLPMPGAH
jgi:hypothetical protein